MFVGELMRRMRDFLEKLLHQSTFLRGEAEVPEGLSHRLFRGVARQFAADLIDGSHSSLGIEHRRRVSIASSSLSVSKISVSISPL